MLLFLIFQVNFIIPAWVYNMYFFIENGDEDDAVPEDEPLIIINDDDDEEHDGDDDGAPTLEKFKTSDLWREVDIPGDHYAAWSIEKNFILISTF